MNALLITATDTGVGKTILTAALAAYWQKYCPAQTIGILKPIQSGVGDRELYKHLFNYDPDDTTPLYFSAPLAPPLAAAQEGRVVEIERAWQAFEALRQQRDFVLVEGVGGLGSPVTHETTIADLAWDWRIPTVLVVPVKLGAIGQAVANVALARQSRVHLKGMVLSCGQPDSEAAIANWAPPDLIQSLTQVPVLGTIPYLSDPLDVDQLIQAAANLELERFFPRWNWLSAG